MIVTVIMARPVVFADLCDGAYLLRGRVLPDPRVRPPPPPPRPMPLCDVALFEIKNGALYVTACFFPVAAEFTLRGNYWTFRTLDEGEPPPHVGFTVSPSVAAQMYKRRSVVGAVMDKLIW